MSAEVSTVKKRPIIWHNIAFMTLTPLAAAFFVPMYLLEHGSSVGLWIFFAACFTISNMSITCGYHRFFAHRSYDAHPIISWLYVLIGSAAFQGSVLQWSTDHRRHHRYVDTDSDPYSINKGFWYAHIFWMFTKDQHPEAQNWAKDLEKNRWIALQHKYYALIATFMGFIVPGLVGMALGFGFWGGLIIGGLLRIVACQHSTFLINSLAHTVGKQTYTEKHTARDSFICAVLTFGEGYHNFHHSFQADYRNGTRWYHWDPTKWWIQLLAVSGLATRLKRAQKEEILKARLAMEERHMLAKGAPAERVMQLKARIEEAQKKVKHLQESYQAAKRDIAVRRNNWRKLMRAEIRMAKIEFHSAYGQWRTFRKVIQRTATAA
jgi:stearoyl-CoA desaturase (delta-9 desaturase)